MRPAPEFQPHRVEGAVNVLLLEGDPAFAQRVREHLEGADWVEMRLECVDTLSGALERLAKGSFELVITALQLSDGHGMEIVGALVRASDRPVIVLTDGVDDEVREAAIAEGAYDVVMKDRLDAVDLERVVRLASLQAKTFRALRQSEDRIRSLTQMSSDWLWEQDEELRYLPRPGGKAGLGEQRLSSDIGKRRWELDGISGVSDRQWHEHKEALAARRPFRDFEYRRDGHDGVQRWLSISGAPVFDDEGRFRGYRGIGRDLTARKREERMVALEHGVTRVLANAQDPSDAVRSVIRAICEADGWEGGRYFSLDEAAGHMRLQETWTAGKGLMERFIAESSQLGYRSGEGMIGQAWSTGDVQWTEEPADDPRVKHPELSRQAGLKSSFSFPVHFEGKVCGVLSISSTVAHASEGRFLKALGVIGSQLGQYLQRVRAEEDQRRFRAAIDASADIVLLVDPASMRHVDANERACRALGYSRDELLAIGPSSIATLDEDLRAIYERLIAGEHSGAMVEGVYRAKDGSLLCVELSRQAVPCGAKHLIVVVAREITERKRAEQMRKLEHTVTRTLADAESVGAGLKAVIRQVCETEGWECGRYFHRDENHVFRFAEAWHLPNRDLEGYIAYSVEKAFPIGVGIVGMAGAGEPQWVEDLAIDARLLYKPMASVHGMRGAFMFAVTSGGQSVGVLSFTSREVRRPDARLLQAVGVIGSQVGQFLQRKQAEQALTRFRAALDGSADMVFLVDLQKLTLLDFNDTASSYLGYRRDELLGMPARDIVADAGQQDIKASFAKLLENPGRADSVIRIYKRKDGRTFEAEVLRRVIESPSGPILVLNARDLTERNLAQERQAQHVRYQEKIARFGESALGKRQAGELIEDALHTVHEALRTDVVLYLESGPTPHEAVLRGARGDGVPSSACAVYGPAHPLALVLDHGELAVTNGVAPLPFGWAAAFPCGALAPVHGDHQVQGALCALSRSEGTLGPEESKFLVTAASVLSAGLRRIHSEGRLAFLAQFDALTGLPNRALLSDRFSQRIVHARRHALPLGVLFIDLDDFKLVNDTLGHAGGDELLKETARRLQRAVRQGDTVARISGDEFAVILGDLAKLDDAALVAQKIVEQLAAPMHIRDQEVFITASIGIAAFPADGDDAEALLGAADAAMYRAKQSGRNTYEFFTAEINQRSRARAQLGVELRRALERGEFVLAYQPKFDLRTGQPCAVEALVRWRHPERGLVAPGEFIPVLEETGLIVPVGEWVLRRACEDLVAWKAAGIRQIPVAVNLSARQFRLQDLDARVRGIVSEAGVDPRLIELEITESQLMLDPEHAKRMMMSLSDTGIRVAIDDFGTGYSSLSYLTRFPVSALKIDRSFIADVLKDRADAAIVRAIIDMAHTLGFIVIAEGVETDAQATLLRSLGCEQAQGYFFARPMPEAELRVLISACVEAWPGTPRFASRHP